MSENLKLTLDALRNYVNTRGLGKHVSLELEEQFIRITLLAEDRKLWLGRRYFLIADTTDEPQTFFELNEATLSNFLALPPSVVEESEAKSESHFLFVSYSRHDEPFIAAVVDLLRLTDTKVFRDRDSIRAGDKWRAAIQKAIQQSTECLIFWCAHSATSTEVGREVELALEFRKQLIPVLLDDSPLNGLLQDFQAIDMRAFQPHVPADEPPEGASPETPGGGLEHVVPSVLSNFPEEAAAYLKKRLEEILGIEPLCLSGQPNTPLLPTTEKPDG